MNSIWPERIELFHPMLVHFPIALLLTAFIARILMQVFGNRSSGKIFQGIFFWSWTLGVAGLAGAYLSGEEAEEVVNKIICNPSVTHEHSDFAFYTLWLGAGALLVSLFRFLSKSKFDRQPESFVNIERQSKLWKIGQGLLVGEFLCITATLAMLVWTAHLGGTLVYEQGAGYLRIPDDRCASQNQQSYDESSSNESADDDDGDFDQEDVDETILDPQTQASPQPSPAFDEPE